ncbi:hypothetical protein EDC01DRAFT_787127 [Geopyxis carbonaria]|nr:hypothetical protein EDC01DRAFT_787127 [Geopyxis carbonaria]
MLTATSPPPPTTTSMSAAPPSPAPSASSSGGSDTEDTFATLCTYCHTSAPIYTCPACFARTCSVPCVNKHKLYRQCTGTRDPAAFVKRSKLMTATGINRDFNFLTALERDITRREDADVSAPGARTEVQARRNRRGALEALLRERGVTVRWAPWEGFEKAKVNQTKVHKGRIWWTLEWVLLDAGGERVVEHRITDKTVVLSSFRDSKELGERAQAAEVEFYLVLQAPGSRRCCVKLDRLRDWKENLRERTVLEYPEILVTASKSGPKGWEVLRDERRIVEIAESPPPSTAADADKDKETGPAVEKAGGAPEKGRNTRNRPRNRGKKRNRQDDRGKRDLRPAEEFKKRRIQELPEGGDNKQRIEELPGGDEKRQRIEELPEGGDKKAEPQATV